MCFINTTLPPQHGTIYILICTCEYLWMINSSMSAAMILFLKGSLYVVMHWTAVLIIILGFLQRYVKPVLRITIDSGVCSHKEVSRGDIAALCHDKAQARIHVG